MLKDISKKLTETPNVETCRGKRSPIKMGYAIAPKNPTPTLETVSDNLLNCDVVNMGNFISDIRGNILRPN